MTFFLVSSGIKVFVVFNVIMVGVALLTLAERRICAWMQDRPVRTASGLRGCCNRRPTA